MIAELLAPAKIIFGLKGDFSQVIDGLSERCSITGLAAQLRAKASNHDDERFSYIGDGIAVPHLRVDNIRVPELVLGLSSEGVRFNAHVIKIILLLVTPAEQPARHLQLLQRVCSLLPAIREELLAERDTARILKIVARAEQQSALPTYINLSQEQIGFELQTDLINGLTTEEALARLKHYGPNLLKRARRTPWTLKLIRNLFSFFAILLWMAALLCFVPGVDLPQLGKL